MATKIGGLLSASLSETVDGVHQAAFEGRMPPKSERVAAARFLASRQGLPGAYAQTFALSDREREAGFKVFTGERMTSALARHIAGEESLHTFRASPHSAPRSEVPRTVPDLQSLTCNSSSTPIGALYRSLPRV